MATISNLQELDGDELKDLCSAMPRPTSQNSASSASAASALVQQLLLY